MTDTSKNTRNAKRRNLKGIMNRPKLTGTNVLVLLLFVMYGIHGLSDALTCTYLLPDCEGPNCEETTDCEHGYCNVIGQCQCDFCFKGKSCSEFEDLYAPRFPIREDTVIYTIGSPGPVYKAHAEDGDRGLTCPLDVKLDCPCGQITYSIMDSWNTTSLLFRIDPSSGYVWVKEGVLLEEGSYHMLTIVASNDVDPSSKDALNLTIMVHTTDSLDDLLSAGKLTDSVNRQSHVLIEDPIGDELMEGSQSESTMKTLIRKKRLSAGADNDYGSSKLMLTEKTTPPAILYPGTSIEYEVKVILPTLSTAMDLVVEVFVMDAVSGETPFALCSPTIVSVGSKITDDSDVALNVDALNPNINLVKNPKFGSFYDRAVINFGKVKNSDTVGDGTTDTADSEIIITFRAVLIQNLAYLNDTATVTAGAEYDQEKYVWVSQSSHSVDMNPAVTYSNDITLATEGGATTVAQWTGMTFIVDAFIGTPSGPTTFQAFTGNTEHDKFTVSHLILADKGSTWACIPDEATTISYKKSASGRSNHLAVLETMLISKDLDYGNLADATTNPNFKVSFAFSIFVMDALPGEIVSVAASLVISDTTIHLSTLNLTVTAGNPALPASTPPTAFTLTPLSSTEVGTQGAVTYGATLTIPDGANTLVDCAIPGDAANYVCGVTYGTAGKNIAYLPNLDDYVVYDGAGGATFQVNINSTGAGANDITFEVSLQYPTGAPGTITMTCNGLTIDLTATSTTAGIEDMSGETFSLVAGDDPTWYEGSQGGILVVLKFPKNGAPYNQLMLETAGDLEVTDWGTQVCKAEIVSAGKGVPCIAGRKKTANDGYILQKATDTSVYNDSIQMDLGSACGVNRLSSSDPDYEVRFRVIYQIPLGQALSGVNYNMSVGVSLDDNLIWTGWNPLTVAAGAPAAASVKVPIFTLVDPAVQTISPGVPYMVKVNLKIHPETVGVYKINVLSSNVAELAICRVYLLAIGANFPCVDPEPYGKDKDPLQVTKIIHDATNWGAGVDIDFGTLRNMGLGSIFSDVIADDDSIALGIMVKGLIPAAPTLTITLDNTGTTTPLVQSFSVEGTDPATGSLTATVIGTDGTDDAYEGVMKMVDVKLTIPEGYGHLVKIRIINTQLADLSLCTGGVFLVGKNLPCLIPSLTTAVKNVTDLDETVYIDLLQVCHLKISGDPAENEVTARFGVMFKDGGASPVTLSVIVTEGTTDLAPISYSVSLSTAVYTPTIVTEGMKLELLDNTTTTVTQGQRVKTAVAFTLAPFSTLPIEFGILTPTDLGRAYVTVHGFSFRVGSAGSNVGCLLEDCLLYKPTIIQNSSIDFPMIHESQTDTLVADLKYITNHGMTHLHMAPKPEDDQIWLEADLLIADHTNSTASGDIFTISFAVKAGNMIFVIEKELVLLVTGTEAIEVATELEITEDTTSPFQPLAQISFTGRIHHDMNVSQEEANNALIRLYFPKYVGLVNDSLLGFPLDMWDSNIPGVVTYTNYIDFNILHLFFTDELEINFTLTVDPNGLLPKGLGVVNATTLLRLVCITKSDATPRYCSNTSYAMFQINGPDCFDSLGLAVMQDCQLSASTAIDAATSPAMAKTGSGGGWSPAVRSGPGWEHYITVDFLKKTRVTQIEFEAVTSTRKVTQFKIQFSHSGKFFTDACPDVLNVTSSVVELPLQCRFEARYGRILIVAADGTEGLAPIGVRFEWFGCPIDQVDGVCDTSITTPVTDTTMGWRHVAHDSVSDIFYFCDFIPKKQRVQCYSTLDGDVWNAMPSYIGRLVGFDAGTQMMYAMDRKERAMVGSVDGINWGIVDAANVATLQTTIEASADKALPVPGKVSATLVPVTFGSWTADYTGISLSGVYKAKWSTCCS
ncbi:LOW QUALITY PROTEIN: uncharacterized protein [Palaemon carinicauda]|uniref:LOW QUALITY PROTEIN: uncharacterized protein n=1 Tax=Palaemon carinicauda TaxID=392227 RepID=UPI0035B59500